MRTITLHLHQPARQRFRYHRDYTRAFEHHIGRTLSRAEKIIITPLEKARVCRRVPRLLVIDPDGVDSRPLLVQYLAWLSDVVNDNRFPSLICSKTTKEARALAAPAGLGPVMPSGVHRTGRSTYFMSPRAPDALRGRNFRFALVLDCDRYRDRLRQVALTVTAPASVPGFSMLVYHASRPVTVPQAFAPPDPDVPIGIENLAPPAPSLLPVVVGLSADDSDIDIILGCLLPDTESVPVTDTRPTLR